MRAGRAVDRRGLLCPGPVPHGQGLPGRRCPPTHQRGGHSRRSLPPGHRGRVRPPGHGTRRQDRPLEPRRALRDLPGAARTASRDGPSAPPDPKAVRQPLRLRRDVRRPRRSAGRPPADGGRAHQTRRSEAALRHRGHHRQRRSPPRTRAPDTPRSPPRSPKGGASVVLPHDEGPSTSRKFSQVKGPSPTWDEWRWRESNPRPTVQKEGFSERSPLRFSRPRRSHGQVSDGLSHCLISLQPP